MAKRLQHKYYGVFAVNPKDPSDFYGYCENSFSMGWFRGHVRVWQGRTEAQYRKEMTLDPCQTLDVIRVIHLSGYLTGIG